MARLLAIALLALATAAALVAPPASATLPGRNGALVLVSVDSARDYYAGFVLRVGAGGSPVRRRFVCGYSWIGSGPFHPACARLGGLAISPDGRGVTLLAETYSREADEPLAHAWRVEDLVFGGPERWRWPLAAQPQPGLATLYEYEGLSWSPDGSQLVLARKRKEEYGPGKPDGLHLYDAAGQDRGQLVGGKAREPDWSASGEVAFVDGGDPPLVQGNLYRMRPGRAAVRLTQAGAADPSWSPDATKVAFARGCPLQGTLLTDDPCVYVVRASGGKPRLVARDASEPVWSPDGKQIAFLRPYQPDEASPTGRAVYTIVLKTGRQRRLLSSLDQMEVPGYGAFALAWLARR
jgi:dipeptidyl aminopeptidase/acylaminoacyl peptidase